MTPVTNDIQSLYKDYAFIKDQACPGKAKPIARVITEWDDVISRTYEAPKKWHLVVFSPLDKAYAKDPAFFRVKGLDKCRRFFKKPSAYVMTREIHDCAKVHVNALVCTEQDIQHVLRNNSIYCNKYYVHVQQLSTPGDRYRALSYITKESKIRTFEKYLDYLIHSK